MSQRQTHDLNNSERYAYDSANRLTAFVRGDCLDAQANYCDAPTGP